MFQHRNRRGGFTMTELLVVIAVIMIISAIMIPNLNSSRGVARDTERVTDIKRLQIAVEEYFDLKANYPSNLNQLENEGLIQSIPTDPRDDSSNYGYDDDPDSGDCGGIDDPRYVIWFEAENPDTFEDSSDVHEYNGSNRFCVAG